MARVVFADTKLILAVFKEVNENCIDYGLALQQFDGHALPSYSVLSELGLI